MQMSMVETLTVRMKEVVLELIDQSKINYTRLKQSTPVQKPEGQFSSRSLKTLFFTTSQEIYYTGIFLNSFGQIDKRSFYIKQNVPQKLQ